jgi:hypothetical protein
MLGLSTLRAHRFWGACPDTAAMTGLGDVAAFPWCGTPSSDGLPPPMIVKG